MDRRPENKKLKIAIAAAYPADPERPAGGPEAGLAALLPSLTRFDDLDLHVVTIDRAVAHVTVAPQQGAMIHRLPRLTRSEWWNAVGPGRKQVHDYLLKLEPEVVHARDTYGVMASGIPVRRVLSVHGFIHTDTAMQPGRLSWLRACLWRSSELRGWRSYPHVISITPYVRERLRRVSRATIHNIENPVPKGVFHVQRRDAGNRILFAGVIRRIKNPMAILHAAERMGPAGDHMEIRLAGGTAEPDYLARMKSHVRASGLEKRTAFLGHLPREQLLEELASASVFVLPSLHENAPVSIGEAMAAGVPVITSDRCGMPYMVSEGETGFLIDPHDPGQIADRIGRLLADPALRQRMGEKARQVALDRFHPDRVAERTRRLYYRIAGEPT